MSDIIINAKPETSLCTSDFDYFLPEEQIAQHPAEPRDSSRLLCVDRKSGELSHKHFYDLIDHLREGDTLVVNDSKVIPAVFTDMPRAEKRQWSSFFCSVSAATIFGKLL